MGNSLNVFDAAGRFMPLSDDQLATLTQEQRDAYYALKSAADDLVQADSWFSICLADNRRAVEMLREAEALEAKKPKWTAIDEARAMMQQWRFDHG